MVSLALPTGWVKPGEHSVRILNELRLEVATGHQLFDAMLELLAQRLDCDDILVQLTGGDEYVVVHLTWSSAPERPPRPSVEMRGTWDAFVAWSATRYD